LYDAFVQLNGSTSLDDFLAEELLDPYSPPEDTNEPSDEPFEKECHPIPIDLIAVNATITYYTVASIIKIQPEPLQTISHINCVRNLFRCWLFLLIILGNAGSCSAPACRQAGDLSAGLILRHKYN